MFDPVYQLLRSLTSPVVAVTTPGNAFIVNSAQRASLVPSMPRLSIYVSKTNYSHDIIYNTGIFALHLLRQDQFDLIYHLGLQSGRTTDKLASLETVEGEMGCPLLKDCVAGFECRVVNAMDTGASTFFLGDVVSTIEGRPGPLMSSDYFRENMAEERRLQYESNLFAAMRDLEELTRGIDRTRLWPGPG